MPSEPLRTIPPRLHSASFDMSGLYKPCGSVLATAFKNAAYCAFVTSNFPILYSYPTAPYPVLSAAFPASPMETVLIVTELSKPTMSASAICADKSNAATAIVLFSF